MNDMEKVVETIKERDNFVLGAHVGPDGDSLGGLIAMGSFLKQMNKEYCLSASDVRHVIPPQYKFLPGIENIKESSECFEPEVFISLECPTLDRLGVNNKLAEKAEVLLNIDHHGDNANFGDINWVEAKKSSICEMIYDMSKFLPVKLDKDIALNLYVGILTDTGRFQYSNVRPDTFEAAKELLKLDLDTNAIFRDIYENRSFHSTVLLGEVIAKAVFNKKKRFAYSSITNEDFLLNNIGVGETEHFIDFLRAIKGVEIAAIFKEVSPKETKISLRSTNGYDVSKIAEKFGGGGHAAASGYTSHKPLKDSIDELVGAVNNVKIS